MHSFRTRFVFRFFLAFFSAFRSFFNIFLDEFIFSCASSLAAISSSSFSSSACSIPSTDSVFASGSLFSSSDSLVEVLLTSVSVSIPLVYQSISPSGGWVRIYSSFTLLV